MVTLFLTRFMAKVFTTEITSAKIASDNPIHQRLFKAYVIAEKYVSGNLLEVGCGEGRGVETLLKYVSHYTAVDKIKKAISELQQKFPDATFIQMDIPPLSGLAENTFDCVVSFQVIEHIKDDLLFLKEIHRVLKPGGTALLTTPNQRMSLSRNPWHIREYLPDELLALALRIFPGADVKGITGNEKVKHYYRENKKAVERITRWDILDLQHKLPSSVIRIPYEILNRMNRNKLKSSNTTLVMNIQHEDYFVTDHPDDALDLLLIVRK